MGIQMTDDNVSNKLKGWEYKLSTLFCKYFIFISMETYKLIPNLKNYEVSNFGNVRNIKTNRILKSRINKRDGYRQINLRDDKIPVTYTIHRLVAITHILNPLNLKYIDHIDRNRSNNEISNLRWVDSKTNANNRTYLKDKYYIIFCNGNFAVQNPDLNLIYTYANIDEAIDKFKSLI